MKSKEMQGKFSSATGVVSLGSSPSKNIQDTK
jgi:hypothetical protein